jgi:hypothetical protein
MNATTTTVTARATTAMDCDILCWEDSLDTDDPEMIYAVQAAARAALPASLDAQWDEDGNLVAISLPAEWDKDGYRVEL